MALEKEYLVFLEDPKFIEWVFYPTKELNEYWSDFQEKNPEQKASLSQSTKLLKQFISKDQKLTAEEKHEILVNALNRYKRKEKNKSRRLLIGFLKYAAVAIIFFCLGYILFYHRDNIRQKLISQNISLSIKSEDAKIILSDGKDITIKSKESSVDFSDNKVVVNKDTIHTKTDKNKEALNQVIIPFGKHSFLTLSDGTEIWLNSGSRLLFPNKFTGNKREVFLVGEAFIKVKENKDKPFVVITNELMVEALGTEFNVSSYIDDPMVETVLTKGSVRISKSNGGLFKKDIYLEPNQIASFNKETQVSTVKSVKVENYTSWKDGIYIYNSKDLSRVLKQMERYFNINFQYDEPFKGVIKISGKLDLNYDRELIINNIATVAAVKIDKLNENRYVVR